MLNRFNSNTKKLIKIIFAKANLQNFANLDLIQSLQNIKTPKMNKFNSKTHTNSNPIKLVNKKSTISNFHQEILENSARYVSKQIDTFDNEKNTLTIYNTNLDYGTEGVKPDNFEVLVFGLQIPGDYNIDEIDNNVVIELNNRYIDFDNVTINDIYVIGKFK
jgi:hypothetical protein